MAMASPSMPVAVVETSWAAWAPWARVVGSGGGDVEVDAGFAARSMTALPLAERAAGRSRGSAAAASANEPSLADRRPRTGCWRPGGVVGSASGPVRGQPPHARAAHQKPSYGDGPWAPRGVGGEDQPRRGEIDRGSVDQAGRPYHHGRSQGWWVFSPIKDSPCARRNSTDTITFQFLRLCAAGRPRPSALITHDVPLKQGPRA